MSEPDILLDIPLSELPHLMDLLRSRLGRQNSTFIVNFIKNAIDWTIRFPTKHYVTIMALSGDWKSHCTIVGNVQMPNYSSLVVFSLEDSNEQLMNALLRTKRIDWKRPILFALIPENNYPVVHRLIEELGLGLFDTVECNMLRIDEEEALKFEYTCPNNTILNELTPSYAHVVNYEWPHKTEGSEEYIAAAIEANDTAAIFIEDTGELVSWAFVSYIGALASLQTISTHKRKGYGNIVTKALAVKMATKGWDPYVTVVTHNEAPKKLFYSLGFQMLPRKVTFFFTSGSNMN